MKLSFATIAAILVLVANVSYSIDIIRGRVRPHAYTWFIWSVVNGIVLGGQYAGGAGVGAIPTLINEVLTVTNLVLALKWGYRSVKFIDHVFLAVAILGILIWVTTDDPTSAVILAVGIDLAAFVPTIRKTWENPGTETPLLFSANAVRHIFSLLSLEAYNIATTLHSVAMIATNSLMTLIIYFRKKEI
ncbi:MAG: hypothetical protein IPM50_15070 [Acidobacteriota bacterium]|nr:MAG: hypothetical protein IPM50_15070 [Acidobacteriota bacterium]